MNHCRSTLHALLIHLAFSLKSCSALHCLLIVHGVHVGHGMTVTPQTPWLHLPLPLATHSVVMLPRYFEYHIERGVEWIRVYTPGMWQPVAESTLGPTPDRASTYRDGAGSTTLTCTCPVTAPEAPLRTRMLRPSPTRPFAYGNSGIGARVAINALVSHVHILDRQISCLMEFRPRRRLQFRMARGVNLLPRRAMIPILIGTSLIDAWTECWLKHCAC